MCKRRETQLEGGRILEACRKAPPALRMGFPGSCGRVRPVESLGRWFLMVVAKGGRTAQTLAAHRALVWLISVSHRRVALVCTDHKAWSSWIRTH